VLPLPLPLPFAWLLAGRAAQGVGLGLTALMMGVARDHLPEERSAAVIALISVVSIIGAGVGYPLAAMLAEFGGVRAAYGLGPVVTAAALLTAWRSMPEAPEGRSAHVDVAGAVVLGAALLLVLFLAGERNLWSLVLVVGVGPGRFFPDDGACTTAVLIGVGVMAVTTLTCLALGRRCLIGANS
jgi:MFS family permease